MSINPTMVCYKNNICLFKILRVLTPKDHYQARKNK